MRCRPWIVRLRLHRGGLACNSSLGESQINKLNRASGPSSGQPDNRKLNEPCARRRIRFFWTRLRDPVCSAELQPYMELSAWLTGIGFEDRGKRDILNCGDGDIAACSSLDQGSLESKSLFCTNLRETITGRDVCPGIGDNGNGRRLAVAKDRGTNALDHSDVSALCLVEGLLARCVKNSDKEVASSLRSQSPLLIQGRGAGSLEETSGQAGVSRGDESSLPHSRGTVSYPRQFNHITADYVSPTQLHSLSYPRKRRSFPACSPLESSHPFARLQPTAAYLYLPTMIPCHRALVFGSVAPPSKFYCIKGCMSIKACVLRCLC